MRTRTVEQSIEIIRRRLDPEGTKEPIIQRQGADRVLVQLPGVDDPEAVKRLLGRTAKLTFQLVDMRISASEAIQRGRTPPGSILMESASTDGRSYVIEKRVMVSGEMLDGATATFDQNNRPAVSFTLNAAGARRFGKVTGENIGRPFAIILDGKVVSAPTIQSQILAAVKLPVISALLKPMSLHLYCGQGRYLHPDYSRRTVNWPGAGCRFDCRR